MRSRRRGRKAHPGARRTSVAARLVVAFGLVVMLLGLMSPAAGANYARIEAAAACDRIVTWRASSSVEGTDDERTNSSVVVDYRATEGDRRWRSAGPEGEFNASNDFEFSGSFALPDEVDEVEVRVRVRSRWGAGEDGAEPGDPRFTRTKVPSECEGRPLVATQRLDCASGSVGIKATNAGQTQMTAEVVVDRVVIRSLPLEPGTSQELVVPILVGRATPIAVRTDGFVASQRSLGANCTVPGPTAVVIERCGATPGRLVVLATGGESAVDADIVVQAATVDSSSIAADSTFQRTLELDPGAVPVEVLLDGQVAAAGETGGCDGPVAGLLSCGTAGRGPCDLSVTRAVPPPPPPPETIQADDQSLPVTGPTRRATLLLLGGTLLAVGGLSVSAHQRNRPEPPLLGPALAPYRQRWWDDSSDM